MSINAYFMTIVYNCWRLTPLSLNQSNVADVGHNCKLQQYAILTSVDSDEPKQPPFKLRNSK